jgi:hypothetical protein
MENLAKALTRAGIEVRIGIQTPRTRVSRVPSNSPASSKTTPDSPFKVDGDGYDTSEKTSHFRIEQRSKRGESVDISTAAPAKPKRDAVTFGCNQVQPR